MGHALSIAAGIAAAKPERTVVCLDGDAAALMRGQYTRYSKFKVEKFTSHRSK